MGSARGVSWLRSVDSVLAWRGRGLLPVSMARVAHPPRPLLLHSFFNPQAAAYRRLQPPPRALAPEPPWQL